MSFPTLARFHWPSYPVEQGKTLLLEMLHTSLDFRLKTKVLCSLVPSYPFSLIVNHSLSFSLSTSIAMLLTSAPIFAYNRFSSPLYLPNFSPILLISAQVSLYSIQQSMSIQEAFVSLQNTLLYFIQHILIFF